MDVECKKVLMWFTLICASRGKKTPEPVYKISTVYHIKSIMGQFKSKLVFCLIISYCTIVVHC
jgi:hypothetical protein